MLTHIVLFWLRDPASPSDREQLADGIRGLAQIDVVRSVKVGFSAQTEARDVVDHSFSVCEILTFASVEDQKAYQVHPLHLRFVEECSHLWQRHVVYDVADAD